MSKISKNKLFILGIMFGLIMCISGIYAFTNTSILKVQNELNTGAINIDLKEYSEKNGQELIYTDSETIVLPGQIISLIPRITNLGDSSYVRAKLTYTGENNSLVQIISSNVDGMDSNWIRKGDYWYYKNVLKPGDKVDIFKTLKIPEDIPNELQGQAVQLNIVAEAVQASNFNPDFNSNSPWNGINAKEANTSYQADKVQINPNAVIEYENSANLYISIPENFFSKLGHVLPGDTVIEEISINNTKDTKVEYFVSTEQVDGISDKGIELLKKLKLKIISNSGVIYDGSAFGIKNCSLGEYEANTLSSLKFIVSVPLELENDYADLSSAIRWHFSVKETEKEPESPQTGDTKIKIAITVFLISAIALLVVLVLEKKTKR